jgi:hypothetical protein
MSSIHPTASFGQERKRKERESERVRQRERLGHGVMYR